MKSNTGRAYHKILRLFDKLSDDERTLLSFVAVGRYVDAHGDSVLSEIEGAFNYYADRYTREELLALSNDELSELVMAQVLEIRAERASNETP